MGLYDLWSLCRDLPGGERADARHSGRSSRPDFDDGCAAHLLGSRAAQPRTPDPRRRRGHLRLLRGRRLHPRAPAARPAQPGRQELHGAPPGHGPGRPGQLPDRQRHGAPLPRRAAGPRRLRLSGLRIVVDCANGAAYKVAPKALYELGAEVFPIGVDPNGFNINRGVGSTSPQQLAEMVRERSNGLVECVCR